MIYQASSGILAICASVDSLLRRAKNKRMALVKHWFDFICFSIVSVAFLGALVLICWRETTKIEPPRRTCTTTCLYECLTVITKAEESSDTTKRAHSLLWKSCWPGLAPAWLLVFRSFSFALLCLVLALDFLDYCASIFVYYAEWTFALVFVYFAIATSVSVRGCLLYYSEKAPNENGRRRNLSLSEIDTEQSLFTSKLMVFSGRNRIEKAEYHKVTMAKPGFLDILCKSYIRCCCFDRHCVLLMGCMHTLNAVNLLIDTSVSSLLFPWFRLAYFVLWSWCYTIFRWVIHACGLTWWRYPFLVLSTPWASLSYFCLAVIHIPCFGLYWLIESAKNSITVKIFPHS